MHHLPVHEGLVLLESDRERGLTGDEATRRLQRHGPNVLPRVKRRGALLRLLLQFHHPLIYVLLVAAAITWTIVEAEKAIRRRAGSRQPRPVIPLERHHVAH